MAPISMEKINEQCRMDGAASQFVREKDSENSGLTKYAISDIANVPICGLKAVNGLVKAIRDLFNLTKLNKPLVNE